MANKDFIKKKKKKSLVRWAAIVLVRLPCLGFIQNEQSERALTLSLVIRCGVFLIWCMPRLFAEAVYRPKQICGKVMFFHLSVSPSVHRGVCIPACIGAHTPLGRHPPRAVHAGIHPPAQCMLGYTSLLPSACWDTPAPSGHCCGWYASYWNAFLFIFNFGSNIEVFINRNKIWGIFWSLVLTGTFLLRY